LADAIAVAQESVGQALAAGAHADAIEALAGLRAPIDSFFDGVLIMDDDLALREMRLRLLNSFVDVFANVADIGKMAKK
jgi:glycyl-tRNA synthetase beta chain